MTPWHGSPVNRSRFCEDCNVYWPLNPTTHACPLCDRLTETSSEMPLTPGQAADKVAAVTRERAAAESRRLAAWAAFDIYCEERDRVLHEPILREALAELDLLPTADAAYDDPQPRTTENHGLAGGELPA